jgi:DNA-binding MarR family transcriptional regulator
LQATKRNQFVNYQLIRSNRFTPNERAVIQIIESYSDRCELKHSDIATMLNRSVSTVQRAIRGLIEKGMIVRTYTVFKRCVLRLKSLAEQKELLSFAGLIKQIARTKKTRMKSSDLSSMTELDRSSVTEPTRSKTLEIKQESKFQFLGQKMPNAERRMSEREFGNERNRQMMAFAEKFGLKI